MHGGNRLGAVVTTGERVDRYPAMRRPARRRAAAAPVAATPRAAGGRRGDLAAALETLRRPPRRRGLVVVISDFLGDADWERPLRGLSARHELLAIEVVDPRELELPDVGLSPLADPETGRHARCPPTPRVPGSSPRRAAAQREQIAGSLRRPVPAHLRLRTDRDWLGRRRPLRRRPQARR